MALRPVSDEERVSAVWKRLSQLQGRIYILWLLGIAVGGLKLKPTSLSVAGATFSFAKPDLIEGLLYAGCVCLYAASFYAAITPYTPNNKAGLRSAIWTSAKRYRGTLKGLSRSDRQILLIRAKAHYRAIVWVGVIGTLLPLIHILIFRRDALWTALKLMFSSAS